MFYRHRSGLKSSYIVGGPPRYYITADNGLGSVDIVYSGTFIPMAGLEWASPSLVIWRTSRWHYRQQLRTHGLHLYCCSGCCVFGCNSSETHWNCLETRVELTWVSNTAITTNVLKTSSSSIAEATTHLSLLSVPLVVLLLADHRGGLSSLKVVHSAGAGFFIVMPQDLHVLKNNASIELHVYLGSQVVMSTSQL